MLDKEQIVSSSGDDLVTHPSLSIKGGSVVSPAILASNTQVNTRAKLYLFPFFPRFSSSLPNS